MHSRLRFFNTRAGIVVAGVTLLLLVGGCAGVWPRKRASVHLRFHLESAVMDPAHTVSVGVGRDSGLFVVVEGRPFLDESNVLDLSVVDQFGGFSFKVLFDRRGTWLLEQASTTHRGRRCVIYCEFTHSGTNISRWIAAPVLTGRIADGVLIFTPDLTRSEADALVKAVQPVIRRNKKESL